MFGFPKWRSGKESACHCLRYKRLKFDHWVRKIPWRRKWQPTPVFLPGKSCGQRSLAGCSPWGCKELNTRAETEQRNNSNMQNRRIPGLETVWRLPVQLAANRRECSPASAFPPLSPLRKAFWADGSIVSLRVRVSYVWPKVHGIQLCKRSALLFNQWLFPRLLLQFLTVSSELFHHLSSFFKGWGGDGRWTMWGDIKKKRQHLNVCPMSSRSCPDDGLPVQKQTACWIRNPCLGSCLKTMH